MVAKESVVTFQKFSQKAVDLQVKKQSAFIN